ncbi:MAG: BMP family ABC transporter substrate-binding protein [Chloroflexi bacterium]|nr:BMP family ABC transporter substrate-binding protein [Chloroflexota bacterium]
MHKKIFWKFFIALAATSILLAACAPAPSAGGATEEEAGCKLKIGYVSDVGKINDQSFNQASWTGVQAGAEALGLDSSCYSFIETADSADYETNINSFVQEGYNVIVTSGFAMGQVTRKVASENPDVLFIGIDQQQVNENFEPDPYDNVAGLNFHEDIGGFLAGATAGLMTKSNVVGGVFGCQFIPAVARYEVGYHNGVTYVNPDASIIDVYHPGSIDQCFSDSAFGSETAQSFINEGADVVYGAGGLTANGALITACNQGAMVIGTDMDQFLTLPEVKDCILTSAMKDIVTGVSDLIVAASDGTFQGGDTYGPSMLAPFHNLDSQVPDGVKTQLIDIANKLSTGEIDPCAPFQDSNPNTFCIPVK